MALRPATIDDLDEIIALIHALAAYERAPEEVVLERHVVADHLFGDDPAARVVLAVDDDSSEVAGFALYFRTFSTWLGVPGLWLEDLFVRPGPRRRGHGLGPLQDLRTLPDGLGAWAGAG